ncbi:MAG: NADH-quinone oxidoreductase subunit H [Polyangiaceae bacterium]
MKSIATASQVLAAWFVAFCALVLVTGCERDGAPVLITVTELAPKQVEAGERLEITGSGFPRGVPARVTFRGTLHRPAEAPVQGASIAANGLVTSSERIEIPFDENLEALFSNVAGDRAHTTFEGTVEVVFAAAVRGAPPIAGDPLRVTLDVRPSSVPAGRVAFLRDEGRRLLDFAGIDVAMANAGRGLPVENVKPNSKAEAAGILPGDVLVSADGVLVHEVSDVAVRPAAPTVRFVKHKGDSEGARELGGTSVDVDLRGFRSSSALETLPALVVTSLATALVLIFFAPPFVLPESFVRKFAHRARGRFPGTLAGRRTRPWTALVALVRDLAYGDLVDAGVPTVRARVLAYGGGALAIVAVAAIPYLHATTNLEVDVVLAFLVLLAVLATSTVAFGGSPASKATHRTWRRRFEDLVAVIVVSLPAAVAVLAVVTSTGSLRLRDLVRAQGGMPWDWAIVRTPANVALFAVFVAAMVVDPWSTRDDATSGRIAGVDRALSSAKSARGTGRFPVTFALSWLRTVSFAILVAAGFLGGWTVPFAAPGLVESNLAVALVASLIFVAKVLAVVLLAGCVERAMPELTQRRRVGIALRVLAPTSFVAFVATTMWVRSSLSRSADTFVRTSVFCVLSVVTAHLAVRTIAKFRRPETEAHLNPFL